MLPALKRLRTCIDACHSRSPRQLRQQLCEEGGGLYYAAKAFVQLSEVGADESQSTPGLLGVFADDGTVPVALLDLLHRMLPSQPPLLAHNSSTSQSPALQVAGEVEVATAQVLLHVFKGFTRLLFHNRDSLAMGSPILLALAAAQPCRLLATVLRLLRNSEAQSQPPAAPLPDHIREAHQATRMLVVATSTTLLSLASMSMPAMAAFGPQLAAPLGLWGLACAAIAEQLPQLAPYAGSVATIVTEVWEAGAPDVLPGCRSPTAVDVAAAFAAEPAFWGLLLCAAAVREPCPGYSLFRALHMRLTAHPCVDPSGDPAHLLQRVTAIADALPGSSPLCQLELIVAGQLHNCLEGHSDRQRAFLPLAMCAERALALALAAGADETPAADSEGGRFCIAAFCRTATALPAGLVRVAAACRPDHGLHPCASAEWKGLGTRARWMTQRGVVASCEALARANARRPPAAGGQAPSCLEILCALDVATLLLDDARLAPRAISAGLSMFATQRKVLLRWVASTGLEVAPVSDDVLAAAAPAATTPAANASAANAATAAAAADDDMLGIVAVPALGAAAVAAGAGISTGCPSGATMPTSVSAATSTATVTQAPTAAAASATTATAATAVPAQQPSTANSLPPPAACRQQPSIVTAAVTICSAVSTAGACSDPTDSACPAACLIHAGNNAAAAAAAAAALAATPASPSSPCWQAAPDGGLPATSEQAHCLGELGITQDSCLIACLTACQALHGPLVLNARAAAGCTAARRLVAGCALQLWPLLTKLAARRLRLQPPCQGDGDEWLALLHFLRDLHTWGMADLTAAVGAPALLRHLLRGLPHDLPNAAILLNLAAEALRLGAGSAAWLREVARLSLLEELRTAAAALDAEAALVAVCASTGEGGDTQLFDMALPDVGSPLPEGGLSQAKRLHQHIVQETEGIVSYIRQRLGEHAGLSVGVHSRPCDAASWDRYLLAASALEGQPEAPGSSPPLAQWVGCCYRGCTNMSATSEAALRLKRCGGCRLTRYCSASCQRKAWRSGHRAACLERLERQSVQASEEPV